MFLYNLGQSYRLANDAEQALYFYRAYLRTAPDSANRAEVEERIAALEKETAARPTSPTPSPPSLNTNPTPQAPAQGTPEPTVSPATATTATTRPQHKPVYKQWWFWTIGGAVVAGGAVGLGVGLGTQRSSTFDANLGTFGPRAVTVRF